MVLYQTTMPSILIETGFITNKDERRFLNSSKGQLQMATQIANAIKKYIYQLKLNTVHLKKEVKSTEKLASKGVVFKVQIASGSTKIATKSYNFKGLKNIERKKSGRFYKYYYGASSNFTSTKKALSLAKNKGFTTAFIVAFKNDKKISVTKALKLE